MPTLPVPVPITGLTVGTVVKSTDIYPAVDTTDTTQSPQGTTKQYTVAKLQSFITTTATSTRLSARVGTTANLVGTYSNGTAGVGATFTITATGVLTIDGVTTVLNDRVLVAFQSAPAQNGIYFVSTAGAIGVSAILTRATDFNSATTVQEGAMVGVSEGTVNAATIWMETGQGPFTLGTTAITFTNMVGSVGGIVPLVRGGTNAALVATQGGIVYGTASAMAFSGVGAAGQVFQSNGTGAPTWSTPTYPSASGTINHYLVSDGTNNVYSANALVLAGDFQTDDAVTFSGAFPVVFNFSASTNVTFPVSGTLATTAQNMPFTTVSGTSQTAAVGNGYFTNNGSLVTVTLPATSAVGDQVRVEGQGAGGWSIVYTTSQGIIFGNQASTITTGNIASTNQYDGVHLICMTANTLWKVVSAVGNITVV